MNDIAVVSPGSLGRCCVFVAVVSVAVVSVAVVFVAVFLLLWFVSPLLQAGYKTAASSSKGLRTCLPMREPPLKRRGASQVLDVRHAVRRLGCVLCANRRRRSKERHPHQLPFQRRLSGRSFDSAIAPLQ
jgi:hypothetical protein